MVICYITDDIRLAYRSYVSKKIRGKEKIGNHAVRHCHFCEKYFVKTKDAMAKHTKIYAAKEGIVYIFENGKTIDFQDNFRYLGDVSVTVYFDFENYW